MRVASAEPVSVRLEAVGRQPVEVPLDPRFEVGDDPVAHRRGRVPVTKSAGWGRRRDTHINEPSPQGAAGSHQSFSAPLPPPVATPPGPSVEAGASGHPAAAPRGVGKDDRPTVAEATPLTPQEVIRTVMGRRPEWTTACRGRSRGW